MAEFNLKKALRSISARVTDDQRNAQEELNRVGRAAIAPDSMEERIARAKIQETAILQQLEMLQDLPDDDLKAIRINNALARLGELYAEQGRYEEAIQVSPIEERRDKYQKIIDAINRPAGEGCNCPPDHIIDRTKNMNYRQPVQQTVKKIVSLTHGRLVDLKICRDCGMVQIS